MLNRFVYLGSAFALRGHVETVAQALVEAGHVITVIWWDHDEKQHDERTAIPVTDEEWWNRPSVVRVAERDFWGIRSCDAFVLIASDVPRKFNGANVELGYALALGKNVYSLGFLERSAMYVPVRRCYSLNELMLRLREGV